ncbi:Csu type fimbrial protein [Sphingomonas abietis]|uniref:Spore coat protein U domain-containing protein n=1 Tax=Sphingomonas abietis TaxID=3012344 RepID=A0ABY7NNA6_9SPHN|nr:spore coat protein U domain-containing protein [Sphingomonas abietis]WBO23007.1 spore coat protein U domain-containing protein [Sphingomonas abietis]
MPVRLPCTPLIRLVLALLLACGFAGAANATCTFSSQALNFTSGSTYDVKAAAVAQITGPAGMTCTGSTVNVLGASVYANGSATSVNGLMLKGSNGGSIPYMLSADPNNVNSFNKTASINFMSTAVLSLVNILGATSFTPVLYASLAANPPNIPAGTYTDTVTINWVYQICTVSVALACVSTENGTGSSVIKITLVVSADCRISAPNVSFNSAPLASQFGAVSQAVLVDCSLNSSYKVSFSAGTVASGSARPWRTMSDGNNHLLQYNIYLADGVTIWDTTNPQQSATPGTGGVTNQMQSYVAKVNPAQITPPAGSYTDTVNVIITF